MIRFLSCTYMLHDTTGILLGAVKDKEVTIASQRVGSILHVAKGCLPAWRVGSAMIPKILCSEGLCFVPASILPVGFDDSPPDILIEEDM